jgi:signal transduction histidine kinase
MLDRQARQMARMIDDLLTVSRIEAGALDTRAEVVKVRGALDEIVEEFGRPAPEIVVRADDVAALVDPDHLHRIVANFVGNAMKYGSPPVELEAHADGQWVEIRVRDHGNGIPDELIPRLFGKFARGESSASLGGTGLGLSIVQGLARANGGDAWYEPNDPSGSCFAVRLPVRAA